MSSEEWVCGYVIEFDDGGEPESQVLHVGSKESCEAVSDMLPAVLYSGDRPIKDAYMRVVPAPTGRLPND